MPRHTAWFLATLLLASTASAAELTLGWDAPTPSTPLTGTQIVQFLLEQRQPGGATWTPVGTGMPLTTLQRTLTLGTAPGMYCFRLAAQLLAAPGGTMLQQSTYATVQGQPGATELCVTVLPPISAPYDLRRMP
jgi:hypothetical protein